MKNTISADLLQRYFSITKEALDMARNAFDQSHLEQAEDFFDMAERYYHDAQFFLQKKDDAVLAFAALNYAHGWLDAGARLGLFQVKDSRLFTVDGE